MASLARFIAASAALAGAMVAPGHLAPAVAQRADTGIASAVWHAEGQGWGTPAADASAVYVLAAAHEVHARDAATGALRWRAHTGEPGPTTAGSSLVLIDDLVVAGDYNVVAFDRRDGALRWRFTPIDGYAPGMYLGGTAGDLVFAGSPAGRLYAIDHRTGTARWSLVVSEDAQTTVFQPVADGDVVVAGFTTFRAPHIGGIVAIETATGRQRWRTVFPAPADVSLDSGWAGGPVITEEAVIAGSGDGVVFALDRRTGSVQWTLPRWTATNPEQAGPAAPRDRDFRPLARMGDRLFAGSLSGEVIAYDLTDRSERWRYKSPRNGSIAFRMLADERSVFVPYVDGALVVLDSADGRERWRTGDQFTGFIWPPAIVGDRVFAADFNAGVFAFSR